METKALVVIDIQNNITKHYRDIVDNINAAIDWAVANGMHVAYIKHHNLSAATRTFKPGSKGEELVPEMKVVSDNIFVKTKSNALTSEAFSAFIAANGIIIIAGDNLRYGNFMSTIHIALRDTSDVDYWVGGADIEQTDEKACIFGFVQELKFFRGGENCLEDEITTLFQEFVTQLSSSLCCF